MGHLARLPGQRDCRIPYCGTEPTEWPDLRCGLGTNTFAASGHRPMRGRSMSELHISTQLHRRPSCVSPSACLGYPSACLGYWPVSDLGILPHMPFFELLGFTIAVSLVVVRGIVFDSSQLFVSFQFVSCP